MQPNNSENYSLAQISFVLEPQLSDSEIESGQNFWDKKKKNIATSQAKDSVSEFSNSDSARNFEAKIIHNPLPKIPDELRYEAFQSEALARFYIAASGEVMNVELVQPCANPKLNYLLLKTLRQWKFSSQSADSKQEIKIKFKVE